MRGFVAVAEGIVAALAVCSPCLALQVTVSSPATSFVQGEPIYVWVDYYNDTDDEVGVATHSFLAYDTVVIRNAGGEVVKCAWEAVRRGPRGGNQVRRLAAREHLVSLVNLLGSFNLKDAGSYSIQVSAANYKPELDLDDDHPIIPRTKVVQGRIESNRWEFTITAGNGDAYELAANDKRWGLFGIHHHAEQIVREYPDSAYAPYAMMEQIDKLLYPEGAGSEPLTGRLAAAQALAVAFREKYARSPVLNIALFRYAENLIGVGERGAAANVLAEIPESSLNDVARLYSQQILRASKIEPAPASK